MKSKFLKFRLSRCDVNFGYIEKISKKTTSVKPCDMLKYHQLPQRGSNRDSFAALPQEDSIGVANYPLTVKN